MSDRRAVFFALAGGLCFLLLLVADERFHNLTIGLGVVYLLLALASYLDFRGRHRGP